MALAIHRVVVRVLVNVPAHVERLVVKLVVHIRHVRVVQHARVLVADRVLEVVVVDVQVAVADAIHHVRQSAQVLVKMHVLQDVLHTQVLI